ncbi:MAG: type II secretion system F family protein, partial [Planctomycetota bacterium]
MATFRYVVMGAAKPGTIEAGDRASALRALVARGETPTTLEEVAEQKGSGSLLPKRAMSRTDLGSFMNELATAVNAGLPLVPALRTIAGAGRAEAQREMIEGIIASVEEGDALGDAVKEAGKPFD